MNSQTPQSDPQNRSLWRAIQASFIEDLKACRHLKTLFQQERSALELRDYEQFKALGEAKAPPLQQLQTRIGQRQQLWLQAGFSSEEQALKAAEQQAPSVAKAWRQLSEQWQECQQLNSINEQLMHRTRLAVTQTLDILRGSGNNRTYDTHGSTQQAAASRCIASA